MNRDAERLDPRFGQNNLSLDTLDEDERAEYRSGAWLRGTKVPPVKAKPRRTEHPTMVDAAPYGDVVRALLAQGVHVDALAAFCGVSYATIRDLRDGKASLQVGTATKLRRMALLLPSEES